MNAELKARTDQYDEYMRVKGIDADLINAYCMATNCAFYTLGEIEQGKILADRAKRMINAFCIKQTGGTIWDLEKHGHDTEQHYELVDNFLEILRMEASMAKNLDSFMLYVEHLRDPKERFYQPRRKCFLKIGLTQALQDLIDDKLDLLTLSLPPGTGKGSRLTADVLTPNGFVKMGTIKVGDEVIAGNGNVAKVLGVFPLGKKPTYRFTLDDGSCTEVSDDHLWYVQTRDDRLSGKHRVVKTSDMLNHVTVENGKRKNYSVEYVPKIDFAEKSFVIAPYVMGVLLGDGGLSNNSISISNADNEVIAKVDELLPDGYFVKSHDKLEHNINGSEMCLANGCSRKRSKIKMCLADYGLCGKHSDEKFIPRDYLYASYEQRLWLLRGLLDTDGYAAKSYIEYTTSSEQLSNDVRELVHSLGGYCSVTERKSGYRDNSGNYVECKQSYRMCIQFSAHQPNPFYLPRKADIYQPKRSEMKRFISSIEYIGEEECQCIYISDPCHLYITDDYIITHNTTIEKFFHAAVCGWYPNDYSLFYSHSGDITRMYYDGVNNILTDKQYAWQEIFPEIHVTSTNAKLEQINLAGYKPFPNLQTATVGGENAGKVRCNRFLFVDDMIGGIEEAMNKAILDKLWSKYSVDARQRKVGKCKEIHIATRWSVHDIIGRLQRAYENDPRSKFIAVPDIDPKTGESNFVYDIDPFTVAFFESQSKLMDDVSYRALYKNDPIEREGLLYHEDELRRYISLPIAEPDAVESQGDTKAEGLDYMVFPVFRQYDDDYYLVDCICDDNADFGVQENRIAQVLCTNGVQVCEIESNQGGSRLAVNVQNKVNELGGSCCITTKATETNKETRIIVNAPWIKQHVIFPDKSLYSPKSDMGKFMDFVLSYTLSGKKKQHDDVVDCLANFALRKTKQEITRLATVSAIQNPFRNPVQLRKRLTR